MFRRLLPFIIIATIVSLYLWPLTRPGFWRSHDGENHLIRFGAYLKAAADGHFPPRWAGELNYRFGTPVLNFFYPLPGYAAIALSALGMNLQNTFKLIAALTFVAAPLTFFLWARLVFLPLPALAASLVWGLAPYHLLDLYVRGDIGELTSFVFAPLVLWAIEQLKAKKEVKLVTLGGLFWALLILSHQGMALLFTPVIIGYGLLRTLKSSKAVLSLLAMFGLALSLSAFFWLPALLEQRYLSYTTLVGGLYREHFPSWWQLFISPWGFGDDVQKKGGLSPQLGWLHTLVALSAAYLTFRSYRDRRLIYFLVVLLVGVLLALPLSTPIWEIFPFLQKLQFPWRMTAVTSFAAAALSGFIFARLPRKTMLLALLLFLATSIPFAKLPERIDFPDSYYTSHPASTTYHGEATTVWAAGDPGRYPDEPVSVIAGSAQILNYQRRTTEHRFVVDAQTPARIIDATHYYPGWRVYVDGVKTPIEFQDPHARGLITFTAPQGLSSVVVTFGETPLRATADFISLLSLGVVIILIAVKAYHSPTIILWGIVVIGWLLRFYQLGAVPIGLHRDEAFLGYNAYSLLKTAREMTGTFLPLHLPSFLWSPAGYSYLSMPFVAFFGLSAFSVRFASAFFGTLTVVLTYFLVQELFGKWEVGSGKIRSKNQKIPLQYLTPHLSLLTSFLLAISPWHINLSRTATENTIVVFFLTLGVTLFLKAIRLNKLWLLLPAFASLGATYTLYQAPRVFLPLFVPVLLAVSWRRLQSSGRVSAAFLYFLIIVLPLVFILRSSELSTRILTVSIFATKQTQLALEESIREDGVTGVPTIVARLAHNKLTSYGTAVLSNYFAHTTFNFLATDKGFPDRYRVPGMGLLHLPELVFFIIGIYFLFRRFQPSEKLLIGWLILAPLGSALTFDDVPNLQRTLLAFPAISMTAALGITTLFNTIKQRLLSATVASFVVLAFGGSTLYYLHQYSLHQKLHRPWYRHEGYAQLVEKVNALLPDFKRAVITNHESSPSIFFLFYNRFDPAAFQSIIQKEKPADLNTVAFDRYEFSQEACPLRFDPKTGKLTDRPGILYVNFAECKLDHPRVIEVGIVSRTDKSTVFRLLSVTGR